MRGIFKRNLFKVKCCNKKCGKIFETSCSWSRFCSSKCRSSGWANSEKEKDFKSGGVSVGKLGRLRKTSIQNSNKLNGRFCQRCESMGISTPLKGGYLFNCPECWVILDNSYDVTFSKPRRDDWTLSF